MALDEPKTNDRVYETEGFMFVMDKDVEGLFGDITIDVSAWGIEVYSGLNRGRQKTGCSIG